MSAMRTSFSVVGCVLLTAISLTSLAPAQTSWWRAFGGTDFDEGWSVQQTTDGGYIIAGYTKSFGAGASDVWLIKTDACGDPLWAKTYGSEGGGEAAYWMQQTTDGGYIVVAVTGGDVWLIKTDAEGDTLWTRTYGGPDTDFGFSVQQTSDSGYVIAGDTKSFGAGYWDFYLIRTNASGDTLWTRTYGGTGSDGAHSVQQTTDGGYIVAGTTSSFGAGNTDFYLIKTDAHGDTLWTRTYGGADYDESNSVQQTADGGYIISGWTGLPQVETRDGRVIKTDNRGDTLWTRTYGGTHVDDCNSVQQTADGGYIIAGTTGSFGTGDYDVYLIKTDASGDTSWTRTFGGRSSDQGLSVQQTTDGGYVITGSTFSFGAGITDLYLIKTDADGYVGVAEEHLWAPTSSLKQAATTLSGTSGVRRLASGIVYDAMGRRVHHPRPGIYFLRTATTGRPRKVLLVE